jgi:hypothetical protein
LYGVCVAQFIVFCVVFSWSLFVFLSFFFWRTLYYLSFYLWYLVTTVVSGIVYPPEPPNSLVAYSEIRVVQSLVFWTIVYLFVHFRQLCCLFFFDIYGFWLSIWYLFLKVKRIYENINLIYFQKIPNRNLLNDVLHSQRYNFLKHLTIQ